LPEGKRRQGRHEGAKAGKGWLETEAQTESGTVGAASTLTTLVVCKGGVRVRPTAVRSLVTRYCVIK